MLNKKLLFKNQKSNAITFNFSYHGYFNDTTSGLTHFNSIWLYIDYEDDSLEEIPIYEFPTTIKFDLPIKRIVFNYFSYYGIFYPEVYTNSELIYDGYNDSFYPPYQIPMQFTNSVYDFHIYFHDHSPA